MPPGDHRASTSPRSPPDPAAPASAGGGGGGSGSGSGRVRAGRLTALLQEIAAVPEDELGDDWSHGLMAGAVVGRFELMREIGRGGFGVVWEARDRQLGRHVAFKAIRAGARAQLREDRLLREAEAAARLSHPNIVTLHDVGRAEHGPYLVLELLVGETLGERLRRGPLPMRDAVRVALEIARGMAHAHAHGVVHRDLKPANVFLCDDGRVKVLDFGMAHAFGQRREDGGTPAYMAPEQRAGAPEDERSDVFALGTMLFEMASGELPFRAQQRRGGSRSGGEAPTLEAPEAPGLGELVARMLERDPTLRPRDGQDVLALLTELEKSLAHAAGTSVATVRTRRGRHVRLVATIALSILLGAVVTVLLLRRSTRPAAPPEDDRAVVAVADFANETRDPDLDGLSGLLITSLEQSKNLRVLTRGRLLDVVREMGKGDAPHIDESLARAAGRKAGVRTLLLASIQKLGDTYAAELRALDPARDEYLFTIREQATAKNDLLPLIDRMSDRARLALHETEADVKTSAVSVREAVTGNLEAYRHYFRGKDLAARGVLREALAEFERAVAIEPRFAIARIEIAWIGYFYTAMPRAEASALVRAAAVDAVRAPAREGGLIRILGAFFEGRFAASRAEIARLAAQFPEDRDVAVVAAEVSAWCGDFEGALPLFERALRLAPDWDLLRFDQVALLAIVGRAEEGLRLANATARQRATPAARAALGVARYSTGDLEGGIEALRSSGADDVIARMLLAQGLAAQGRIEEALSSVARLDDAMATQAQVLAYAGRLRDGLAKIDQASRRPKVDIAFHRKIAAGYLAAAGDVERARQMAAQADLFTILDGVMLATVGDQRHLAELVAELGGESLHGRFLRALAAHRSGDRNTALSLLRTLDKGTVSFVPYFRGLVAAEAGEDEEAVEAFRRFERPVYWASDAYEAPWFLARARLLMARSLGRLGRTGEARKVLDLQLERWRNADASLPLLAEMKALRAKLDSAPDVKSP
jgi:eukaryotic-like serine/threonine-protein kinase